LHGAHVIDYTPADQQPVIFTSKNAIYREGKAIRGGIPVCWPWFNAHPTDSTLPSHGYARNAFWELLQTSSTDQLTTLSLRFIKDDLTAHISIEIGKTLNIKLTTTNTGQNNHTITGLEGADFLDTVNQLPGKEKAPIQINEEIDRVYQGTSSDTIIQDHQWNREILIQKSGSQSTVVWNPWIDKSATMADLGNEEYQTFVCIETANALQDVYQVAPGGSHTMTTTYLHLLHHMAHHTLLINHHCSTLDHGYFHS